MIFASFDLDGTLVNSLDLILLGLAEQGFMVDKQDSFAFKFLEGYAPPPDFQWDLFFYRLFTERFCEMEEEAGAYEFLKRVYREGDEPLRVITARAQGVLMPYACKELLNRLFPEIDFSIDIVESGKQKYRYLFGTDIFFDDRRETAIDLAQRGLIVFMRNADYNKIESRNVFSIDTFDDRREIKTGTIVTYNDFHELMEKDIHLLVRPF